MKKILYLTDLYYEAKGRRYYEEDLYITQQLMDHFDVVLCNPKNSEAFEHVVDLIVFRNTGGVQSFKEIYDAFVKRVKAQRLNTFNDFTGKADMCGKDYLLALYQEGYAVTPTVDRIHDVDQLPDSETYVLKPKDGADSNGLEFVSRDELLSKALEDGKTLIQPALNIQYEVSFYFINQDFQYALYAPDQSRRWELVEYHPTNDEIDFAKSFITWNDIEMGIQRIDAAKLDDGRLLLVELEDLNPYLSVLELSEERREQFIGNLIDALHIAAQRQ